MGSLQETPNDVIAIGELVVGAFGEVDHAWEGGEGLGNPGAAQELLPEWAVCWMRHSCEEVGH